MTGWSDEWGLGASIVVFCVGALAILVFGSKLERWADAIAERTELGHVFAGMILLAISTSLPEVATSITATLRGEVDLAVNNMLGSVVTQTMVLALSDAVGDRRALTRNVPSFGLLIQGVGLILVLALVIVAVVLETRLLGGWLSMIGPALVLIAYLFMQYVAMRARDRAGWEPVGSDDADAPRARDAAAQTARARSLPKLLLAYAIGSVFVCAGGYLVVLATERVAAITGAQHGFLGFTVVAFATSLPEIATTVAAARRGHNVTAVSNIFGSNGFVVALLALVAVLAGGPIFAGSAMPTIFSAGVGVLMTGIYLVGMLERRDRAFLRMGVDSLAVLVLGLLGFWGVYALGGG